MDHPIISIVTVCFNAEKVIKQTMTSVLNQTYDNIEYIIVDGASSDDTVNVIEHVLKDYPQRKVAFKSEPDNGIYDAMNKAIDMATGEWINFMNAGDEFVDEKVLDVVSNSFEDTRDVVFGNTILSNNGKRKKSKGQIKEDQFPHLGHQSTFVRTSLMKLHHYNLSYVLSADFDFLYTLYKEQLNFYHTNTDVALYDVSGISSRHRAKLYLEHCKIQSIAPSFLKLLKYRIEDAIPMCIMKAIIRFLYY